MREFSNAKAMAKAMRSALADKDVHISHSEALEIVARQFGFDNWNILASKIAEPAGEEIILQPAIPIMRIFDEAKAREFYLDFLGFAVDWEHRFAPNMPLYMQVSRGDLSLHLSEHSGDATPGGNAVVFMTGIKALHAELHERHYKYNRPGLEKAEWGLELGVIDPFSNRLRFIEKSKD
ncbi:glyoxalase superfamily protein [uncultured Nitratireductor sp.]|uniref:glyoxalase superfamily protein n=1 Tax=uncultured Nitratireductor sp. TaxID=520953 RepID=UPI0025D18673|nr:glyoxalase superfamily protein [uncultured Nitratireductor sp.]